MPKGKLTLFSLIAILILIFVFATCAQPAPTPAPSPLPTPTPEKPKSIVNFRYIGTGPTTTGGVMALAEIDLCSKYSTWLRGSWIETLGMVNTLETMDRPQDRNFAICCSSALPLQTARKGPPVYPRAYNDLKVVFNLWAGGTVLALNFPYTGPESLKGKKYAVGPKGGGFEDCANVMLGALGAKSGVDGVEYYYSELGAGVDAFIDGKVQGVPCIINGLPYSDKVIAGPFTGKVVASAKNLDFADIPKETMLKYIKTDGALAGPILVPANSLGNNFPKKDIGGLLNYAGTACWDKTDYDFIYEFVRVCVENVDKLGGYSPTMKEATKQWFGIGVCFTEKDYHPAAVDYFKKAGIPLGKW